MVLLDMLAARYRNSPHVYLVVAHFDHGIRSDSVLDRRLVHWVAKHNGLSFVYDEGKLGSGTSEEAARNARYAFLRRVREVSKAQAVITAHHQDDVLETAIHNILRGTNRRGLTSLKNTDGILRPLLSVPKRELIAYARQQKLQWNEDITNQDIAYKRNYIRHVIVPKLSAAEKTQLMAMLQGLAEINTEIDTLVIDYLHMQPKKQMLDRGSFIMLPHVVAREVLAAWLRSHALAGYDQKMLERLVLAAKTLPAGKHADIYDGYQLEIKKENLALVRRDR